MDAYRFGPDDLPGIAAHWDRAVDRTPDVDAFCASTIWSFSAATSFPHAADPVVVGTGDAFCGMRSLVTEDGRPVLVGLDPVWGFAMPLVGPPMAAAATLAARLSLEPFDLAVVAGQSDDTAMLAAMARTVGESYRLFRGATQQRLRADLSTGVESWFRRRTPRFRQRLRGLRRVADERGLDIVDLSSMAPDAVFDRILAVESTSWKGDDGTGLAGDDLATFYRQICHRLAAQDHLRVLVARLDDHDVGFILGGIRGDTYRGLQLSYARSVHDLGVGHLLQFHQIERLVTERIGVYDLGMDMEYKRRWADRADETFSVIVAP